MKFRKLGSAVLSVALVGSLMVSPVEAYVYNTLASGQPLSWDLDNNASSQPEVIDGAIQLTIHQDGSPDIADGIPGVVGSGSDIRAVNACIKEINQAPDTSFRYKFAAFTTSRKVLNDNVASVFWTNAGSSVVDQDDGDAGNDIDLTGALGVTFTQFFTAGANTGRIFEMDIAMNSLHDWTTDPINNAARQDIKSVLVHEMLHGAGMHHSAVAESTMFPRNSAGAFSAGSLSDDDKCGLRAEYGPTSKYGSVEGVVEEGGVGILGAHVVLVNAKGSPVAGGLTNGGGDFDIAGVPPGTYTAYVEPLDANPAVGQVAMCSPNNLPTFFATPELTFLTSATFTGVEVTAGGITNAGTVAVTDGTPALNITRVGLSGSFSNGPKRIRRANTVTIGVSGPGLPTSGTPLSISGTGVTINNTTFTALGNGDPVIQCNVTIAGDAPVGSRNIIVDNGTQRTIATGGLEILGPARANADFDGDGATDFGVYRKSVGDWYLRWGLDFNPNNALGGFDARFKYGGDVSDFAVSGDWNGDGLSDVGLYRHATSTWYLLTNRTDTSTVGDTQVFNFGGDQNDIPVVGDWNGDGKDGIGIFRISTGEWYLNDGLNNSPTVVVFGGDQDSPMVGDFNGDGIADLGLYRFNTGQWFLDTNRDGNADEAFFYGGAPDDFPVVGDFDGDGDDDPGLWRAEDPNVGGARWFMAVQRNGTAVTGDMKIAGLGLPGDQPLRGDFNGDGIDDPAVYNFSSGTFRVVLKRDPNVFTGFLANNTIIEMLNFQYGGDPSDYVLSLP